MTEATKMVGLDVVETSGVDHPAHLSEGWVVLKATDPAGAAALLDTLTEEKPVADEAADKTPEATAEPTPEETLAKAQADLTAANERIEALEKAAAEQPVEKAAEPTEDDVLKALPEPIRARFEALEKAATESAETLRKERETVADAQAVEKAKAWTGLGIEPDGFGPALRQVAAISPALAEAVEKALSAAVEQAQSGELFSEVGKSAPGSSGEGAYARLDAIAKAAATQDGLTYEVAFSKAVTANPDLYTRYLAEKG